MGDICTPQLVYGLELYRIGAGNLQRLDICQNRILRKHLPEPNATVALHLLAGISLYRFDFIECFTTTFLRAHSWLNWVDPHVQATIERSTLMLFRNLVDQKSTKEHEIIERQLAMKDHKSNSWVVHVKELLTKYDLPSTFVVFQYPPSKSTWKRQVKKSVDNFWLTKLKDEVSQMATLENFNTTQCLFGKVLPLWHYTPYNRTPILQACTLVKFKVGRYHPQEDLSKFRGTTLGCPLCKAPTENLPHMILHCQALSQHRAKYIKAYVDIIEGSSIEDKWDECDEYLQLKIILDPSSHDLDLNTDSILQIQQQTRCMVYALHNQRSCIIDSLKMA